MSSVEVRTSRDSSPTLGLFVTGNDTAVGKTRVAAAIARDLVASGIKVGVYKPAASGCRWESGQLVSDDALDLWTAAGKPDNLNQVCPQRFAAPLAPHLAARHDGQEIDPVQLRSGLEYWKARSQFIVVEGAGGLMSPIGDCEYVATLAAEFGFPLIIVAANRLGVVNQTLQTCIAAESVCGGLPIAGVILNEVSPLDPIADPSVLTNRTELQKHCRVPILANLAFNAQHFDQPIDWRTLASLKRNR